MQKFTQEEQKIIIDVVNSGKSIRKQAPAIAKMLNRTEMSVLNKMYYIKNKLGLSNKRKRAYVPKTQAPKEAVKPQQNFGLNFTPSRTEIHKDHVRLYF